MFAFPTLTRGHRVGGEPPLVRLGADQQERDADDEDPAREEEGHPRLGPLVTPLAKERT